MLVLASFVKQRKLTFLGKPLMFHINRVYHFAEYLNFNFHGCSYAV